MTPMSRRAYAAAVVAFSAVIFVAVNIAADSWLRTARLDLTEGGLYTLSGGTRNVLHKLEEPITLKLFYSNEIAADYAQLNAYAGRVRDLLSEYAAAADGKLIIEEIDPEPFTEAEDEAFEEGLRGAQTQDNQVIYFGLVGTNTIGGREVISFLSQEREEYLEYDLTSLVYRLSLPEKPKIGVITGLPLETGEGGMLAAIQGRSQPYVAYDQLRAAFDVEMLERDFTAIPAGITALVIAHPPALNDTQLYAIDQFVLRGGRALVFVDPFSEIAGASQQMGFGQDGGEVGSDLPKLFAAWGIDYSPAKVAGDRMRAQRVQYGGDARRPVVDYVVWLRLGHDDVNPDDPVTANLQLVNLATAGTLKASEGATTTFTPLIRTSSDAALFDTIEIRLNPSPDDLLRRLEPTGERFVLAARVAGPAKSAFPDGAPPPPAKPEGEEDPAEADEAAGAPPGPHIPESQEPINVVVIADSDLLADRFWVQVENLFGERLAVPTADNGALLLNAAENLVGSGDLISLRTRARSARPFTLVAAIRREAEARFLAEYERLQQKLGETEARIRQLQQGGGTSGEIMTPEQEAEVEKFTRELIRTRAELRDVQHNLRKDIDALGSWLAFVNIALVPFLVAMVAVGLAVLRRRRRAQARTA